MIILYLYSYEWNYNISTDSQTWRPNEFLFFNFFTIKMEGGSNCFNLLRVYTIFISPDITYYLSWIKPECILTYSFSMFFFLLSF